MDGSDVLVLKIELLSEIFYSKIFSVFHFKGAGGFRSDNPYSCITPTFLFGKSKFLSVFAQYYK